ncbi:RUS1 family protein homolog [Aspergillus awamori]|uniref:RUS1 family protein homolog n=1 Tax=Aspergillus awamori TaxID=105351 RepID=A0A401KSJ2_ASPAW|nr:RUS1 family protein homolog [Aspergillus awamori]
MAPKEDSTAITFTEVDEVNHPTATYIYSEPAAGPAHREHGKKHGENWGRVDVAHASSTAPAAWSSKSVQDFLVEVFLPAGYPHSVTDDYAPYQLFDSLQAFSSSIAGLLSSRAVLQGVGVGNADASPTAALLLHILQDTSGRIATILFAHRVGTALEPECKMYRLAADIFNDLAMILDCLSPMIPAGAPRVTVLSTAGVLRALCGVAGGSSKASLSAHFSRWGNLAEVNAKDSSQETIISLIGMLVGSFVVSRVTSFSTTWICLLILQALHLSLNYAAVRSVQMTSLNRQRANIVFSTLLNTDPDLTRLLHPEPSKQQQTPAQHSHQPPSWKTLTPAQVSKKEKIFETDGILRWSPTMNPPQTLGYCRIGISLHQFLSSTAPASSTRSTTSSRSLRTPVPIPQLTTLFSKEDYILYLTNSSRSSKKNPTWHASILLKNTTTSQSQLKAWAHALLAARVLSTSSAATADSTSTSDQVETTMNVLERTLEFLNEGSRFNRYTTALIDNGWDLSIAALETRSGRRVVV